MLKNDNLQGELMLAANQFSAEKEYWLGKLSGELDRTSFPYDFTASDRMDKELEALNFKISGDLFGSVMKLCKGSDVRLHMLLAATIFALLYKYTGKNDIMIGAPIYKQEEEGQFINTVLILRNSVNANMTFKELLMQVKQTLADACKNQNYPVETLLYQLGVDAMEYGFPLFDTMVLLENIHERKYVEHVHTSTVFTFTRREDCIEGRLEYHKNLYRKSSAERIIQYLCNLLEGVLKSVDLPILEIDMMSGEERKKLLYDFNHTTMEYTDFKVLHQLFEAQVEKSPDDIAVEFKNELYTYRWINNKANSLAMKLREKGIGPDRVVALMCERSPEMITGILGILKAGGAYLPIEPEYPKDRIRFMLEDSGADILLTTDPTVRECPFVFLQSKRENTVEPYLTCKRAQIKDFDSLPIPDRTYIDYEKYSKYIGMSMVRNTIAIQATRGCPYQCAYCHKVWPKSHVVRSAENIFKEILIYYNIGVRRFSFIDDIFNLDKENSSRFFKLIIENGLKVQLFFTNGLRGDILTKEDIDLMVKAGTVNVGLALETGSPRLQRYIGKNMDIEKLYENAQYFVEKHPQVILDLYTMHSFPTETEEEARMTLNFIKSVKWFHFPAVDVLKVYPGTDMEKLALENGVSEEAIESSLDLMFHEIPETLTFTKSFTLEYQTQFLQEYFLLKERLVKVLPVQMRVVKEDELIKKYNTYLPIEVKSFNEFLDFVGIKREELGDAEFLSDDYGVVPDINERIRQCFPEKEHDSDAYRILFLDLSHYFSHETVRLSGLVEPPLGFVYLLTYIKEKFGTKVNGKIVKSGIDFDSYAELKEIISEFKPDMIGVRTLSLYRNFFHQTLSRIRQWGFHMPIVSGGPYATSSYSSILKDKNLDLIVLGEGEATLAELLDKIFENGRNFPEEEVLKGINGVAFVERKEKLQGKAYHREIMILDSLSEEDTGSLVPNPSNQNKPENLAYIIYTSGTTGRPKGVMVEHRGICNTLLWRKNEYGLNKEDHVLQLFSYAFDGFLTSFFTPVLSGAKAVFLSSEESKDIIAIKNAILEKRITHFICVPTLFSAILDAVSADDVKTLRVVTLAGERVTKNILDRCKAIHPQLEVVNEYGPTESSVASTRMRHLEEEDITIGTPISNTRVYIVNAAGWVQPIGIAGELCIAGDGLARAYVNMKELTAEKFIRNDLLGEARIYRTGDLARFLHDGRIQYLGRVDNQVKIRGFRIELLEIETQILKHKAVKEAVVMIADVDGDYQLYAYFVSEQELTTAELRDFLLKSIPEYMVPARFIRLTSIPFTINGKVDRKALKKYESEIVPGVEFAAPTNPVEEQLTEVWKSVLGVNKIGIDDNFFHIGGHSLKATNLVARIHRDFHVEIPLREIFSNTTIRTLAAYIGNANKKSYLSIQPLKEQENEFYPLSSAQRRLFILDQMEGIGTGYNTTMVTVIEGRLDVARMQQAFRKLIERHEAFRTSFDVVKGEPVQKVHPVLPFEISCIQLEDGCYDGDTINKVIADFTKPFDLRNAPLFRVGLVKVSGEKHLLMYDMHHIITDGTSLGIIMKEFASLYKGEEPEPVRIQYKDFAVWQNHLFSSGAIAKQEDYWKKVFSDEVPVLNMPYDFQRPALQSFEGDMFALEVDKGLVAKIKNRVRENGITTFMLYLAAYNILLSKYSGQEDIVVGTPVAGRHHADLESTIGMFVNTLAIRNLPTGSKTFMEFLWEVKENSLAAFENQDYQFEELVEKVDSPRNLSRNPLFDVMFTLPNVDLHKIEIEDLTLVQYEHQRKIAAFDLTLGAVEGEDSLTFCIEYCTKLFKRETIETMAKRLVHLLNQIVDNPLQKLCEIEIAAKEERDWLKQGCSLTEVELPLEKTIHELFEEQVAKAGGNPAVVFDGKALTYGQLNKKANRIAWMLREKGVKEGSIVGIIMERSVEAVIAIMAVLKAGGAYLPMDPAYPAERINYILEDSGISLLLTKGGLDKELVFKGEMIDLHENEAGSFPEENPGKTRTLQSLAYIIYTSGSTGVPKGVMIEDRGVINLARWFDKTYHLKENSNVLQMTNLTFDVAVEEILVTLVNGAVVVIPEHEILTNSDRFCEYLVKNRIHIAQFVPATLKELLSVTDTVECLNIVICGGDTLDEALKDTILAKGYELYNHYGPTETTVDVLTSKCTRGKVLLGKPIDNIKAYVVDSYGTLQATGIPGELCIAGIGVARGYLNRKELTEERFIINPFVKNQVPPVYEDRIYKTGDIVKMLPDGSLEFLGRKDHQVKIRGYRIELGEIEDRLLKYKGIREAVVLSRCDASGDHELCAYIAPRGIVVPEVKEYLAKELPHYMVPANFVVLDRLPRTRNRKIDRTGLPEPETSSVPGYVYAAPENETEKMLAAIWKDVLKVNAAGRHDNFFVLGGNSLKAISLITRIHREMQAEISLSDIFKGPTVSEMAKAIRSARTRRFSSIGPAEEREYYPVSSAQRRMYILNKLDEAQTGYNMPEVLIIEGKVDRERLKDTFQLLIDRHEILRTSFELVDADPVQRIHKEIDFDPEYTEAKESEMEEMVRRFVRPFDLGKAPLLRLGLVKLEEDRYALLTDMNHIIADGVSTGILVREFVSLWRGADLPPLKLQYKDYAVWQNRLSGTEMFCKQKEYWLNTLKEIPVLNLPTDYPRPAVRSFEGDVISFSLGKELTEGLREIAGATGATLYMVLMASYTILLSKYTGQEDIVVGTPVAGRPHVDVENMIGMFVNTLALRNYPESGKTFKEFLNDLKERTLKAFENQDYPFEDLVESMEMKRDLSRNPVFDTLFVFQNFEREELRFDGFSFSPYGVKSRTAKYDVTLSAVESPEGINFGLEYCTGLFQRETMERWTGHFTNIVKAVVINPGIRLSEIEILSEKERAEVLVGFNPAKHEGPCGKTVNSLFEEVVEKVPHHIALDYAGSEITYRELNARANRLARVLRRKGIRPGEVVGILSGYSIEMIVSILAVLKAGGAYLPVDPGYPAERIHSMLKDSNAKVLLVQSTLKDTVESYSGEIICVDDRMDKEEDSNLDPVNLPEDLVYLVYTSGSSGAPKGVMVEHQGLVNYICWRIGEYGLNQKDVTLQLVAFPFDGFGSNLYSSLLSGGKLILPHEDERKNFNVMGKMIGQKRVSVMSLVPSIYRAVLEGSEMEDLRSLRLVVLAAEKTDRALMEKSQRLNPKSTLVNEYGPTEASIAATALMGMTPEKTSVIGRPIDNTRVYILDGCRHPVPVGVTGELYLSGTGLARGYLNQPLLTEERFVPNPFDPKERMYRTGDFAKWMHDGNIEFVGRVDRQIKVRGNRVEPGEIESCLLQYSSVKEVLVTALDRENKKSLCAYIVSGEEIDPKEMRRYLEERLPAYMVPVDFVRIEKIPLMPSGKVDVKLLPIPTGEGSRSGYTEPSGEIEIKIAEIFGEVLELESVEADISFFELGGHSLNATHVVFKINRAFGINLPLKEIFRHPSVRELGKRIVTVGQSGNTVKDDSLVLLQNGAEKGPNLFFVHGGNGEIEAYVDFCSHLTSDLNFWAIRADRLHDYDPENLTVEEIAKRYIVKIRRVQPHGPYNIAGWCIGGTIAFEMVNQLEKENEDISFFAMINSDAPERNLHFWGGIERFTAHTEEKLIFEYTGDDQLLKKIQGMDECKTVWQQAIKHVKEAGYSQKAIDSIREIFFRSRLQAVPSLNTMFLENYVYYMNIIRTLNNARGFYIPENKIKTKINFFEAGGDLVENKEAWKLYCEGDIRFYQVKGDHYSMLKDPDLIIEIVRELNRALEKRS